MPPKGNSFKPIPDEDGQKSCNTVKDNIAAGKSSNAVFHAIRPLYKCLLLRTDNIPRHPYVESSTNEAFGPFEPDNEVGDDPYTAWVKKTFDPCEPGNAILETDVKKLFRKESPMTPGQVPVAMRDAGFLLGKSNGTFRYVKFELKAGEGKKPVGPKRSTQP